jgi:hypothetical protein
VQSKFPHSFLSSLSFLNLLRETLDKLIENVPNAGQACNGLIPNNDPPPPLDRKEYPQVVFWTAKSFEIHSNNQTGETDGLATHQKRPGRRSKSEIYEDRHPYLENKDGSAVPREILAKVGQKARRLWHAMNAVSMAPSSWGKASEMAYKYFNGGMLNEPEFVFFRYCEGNWKLMRWATRAYASWAHNHMKSKAGNNKTSRATKRKRASLDDPSLIRLDDDQDLDIPTAVSPPPDAAPVDDTPSSLDSVPSQVLYVHIRHRDIY